MQAMGLMEQLPLQSWGEKNKTLFIIHWCCRHYAPWERTDSRQQALPVLTCGPPIPRSSALLTRSTPSGWEGGQQMVLLHSFWWGQGSLSVTFTQYFQKRDDKYCTMFSGAVEFRISPASYFPTGMLSSEHFCSLLLFILRLAGSACCLFLACNLISKNTSFQHPKSYSITLLRWSIYVYST